MNAAYKVLYALAVWPVALILAVIGAWWPLAAPFGLLAALLWFSGTAVAKLAMLVAGWGGHGPVRFRCEL